MIREVAAEVSLCPMWTLELGWPFGVFQWRLGVGFLYPSISQSLIAVAPRELA